VEFQNRQYPAKYTAGINKTTVVVYMQLHKAGSITVLGLMLCLAVFLSPAGAVYEGDTALLWGSGSDEKRSETRSTEDMARQGELYYNDIARYLAGMPQQSANALKSWRAVRAGQRTQPISIISTRHWSRNVCLQYASSLQPS
jgi:hypothetical protein